MSHHIILTNEAAYPLDEAGLREAARQALKTHQAAPAEMTIVVTDDNAVAALNAQYRGTHAPTDVLSFPAEIPVTEPDAPTYLGDLVIAYPYAKAQAEREKHPLDASLSLLVVHGTLHLLGFDHDTPTNKATMWAAQAAALQRLRISEAIVPALEEDDDHEP